MRRTSLVGRVLLNRYEVIRLLGEGGMGRVYLAKQREGNRQVAVKVLQDRIASDPRSRERFVEEMAFMTRFQHPHVVTLFDASVSDKSPCIVMEYIDGIALNDLLERHGRLSPARVGRLLGQLCSALQAAHDAGIVHRDLKPANIMVMEPDTNEEKIKVMDFGLAKLASAVHLRLDQLKGLDKLTATGTPDYIAPEQVRGDEMDHRGDIYGVGVMLFELLTGQLPFRGRTPLEVLEAHAEQDVPKFDSLGIQDVPLAVERVVRECLSKYPVERPQTALALAQRYEKALGMKLLLDEADTAVATMQESKVDIPLKGSKRGRSAGSGPDDQGSSQAVVHHLEAYMPEPIAVVKLRGFMQDVGGQVMDSVPGMVRVRLGGPGCKYQPPIIPGTGFLSWFGLGGTCQIEMELLLQKGDMSQKSQLQITVQMYPANGQKVPVDPAWSDCCDKIIRDLKAYLMGR